MLKPLVEHMWCLELEQYFANMNGKDTLKYEDLCKELLRGGSVGDVTLLAHTLLPTTRGAHERTHPQYEEGGLSSWPLKIPLQITLSSTLRRRCIPG